MLKLAHAIDFFLKSAVAPMISLYRIECAATDRSSEAHDDRNTKECSMNFLN